MSPMFLRPARRLPWIVTALLLLLGTGTAAYAFWAATTSSSNAAAAADTLSPGSRPAVAAAGSAMTVSWAGGTTVNGSSATGYTVTRYSAATGGTGTPATGGCAGTVTTLNCTEQNVQGGTWYYTVTPAIALWTGAESPRSSGTSNDSTAPVATVSGLSPTANAAGWNNTSPVTVTITADDGTSGSGVASISYAVDGGAKQMVNAAVATVPVSGDGTHTVSYFATDKVGNAGSAQSQTVKIDTQAPAAPGLTVPAYVYSGNVAAVPVTGTAEAGATITLTAADAGAAHSVPITVTASGTGTWSVSLDLGSLNQGTVTYAATATDAAGNTGASGTATSIKDTDAPAPAQSLKVPTYVNLANSSAVPVSGTAEIGATVTVTATSPGSAAAVTGTATSVGGTWSLNMDLGSLKDGTVTYTATVQDAAGNTSRAVAISDTKDTAAPVLTITAPMYASTSSKVTGTTDTGTIVSVTVRDSALKPVTTQVSPSGTSWSTTIDISTLSDGTLTYTATTTDAAGNTGTATAAGTTTKDTVAPTVTGVKLTNGGPKQNSADKGDTVTIQFAKAMDPAKFCSSASTATTFNGTATLSDNGTNDILSFSTGDCTGFNIGTVSLGSNYVTATATFGPSGNGSGGASTLTLDSTGKTLTIKLGNSATGNTLQGVSTAKPSYTPSSNLTDVAGNPFTAPIAPFTDLSVTGF
ncbi:beta strand repeat-containing protein [Pseudarthrobacter sp. alpha12b]